MAKARSSRTSALNDDPYDVLAVDSDVTLLSTLPPAWSALLSQLPSQRPEAYDIVNEALAQDQVRAYRVMSGQIYVCIYSCMYVWLSLCASVHLDTFLLTFSSC
jgi:hypothetical protein